MKLLFMMLELSIGDIVRFIICLLLKTSAVPSILVAVLSRDVVVKKTLETTRTKIWNINKVSEFLHRVNKNNK